ncbi:hypothetical protein Rhe02_33330 [Rhizocola hellebori]|uniref:YCII-related domain-containing protein n=1 Tax=Rhizocola hellebori TaxID=1392758 RepID=A0A8J3Q7I1_9ACTN|nr:YciI family protein [Rhizocola hellebori]GIH05266.1 hypothetical protein Rhe02_33330 [Rhizocola hellebori]
MKYLLMMNLRPDNGGGQPWTAQDMQASGQHMQQIWQELTDNGELIDTGRLAGPQTAKIVISDGVDAPVVSDGPFPEMKEFLAGYWLIDVDSEQRAIDIAARTSAGPGPGGQPMRQPIEVRAIMSGAKPEL